MGWVVVIVVLAVIVVAVAWVDYGRNKEVASEVEVLNPGGKTGTVLVVYHRGKSDFQRRVFSGFIEGLASNGWRVESTTPSALVKFHTAHKLTREGGSVVPPSRHGPRALKRPVPWHYTEMARRVAGGAWSPTRASGIGTNSPPSMGPCSWRA